MAQRAKTMCRMRGCHATTRDASGYCEAHRHGFRKEKGDLKQADPFYTSWRWTKFSLWYRRNHPLCAVCRDHVSELVHHIREIQAGGDPFLMDNVQALCRDCHNRIHHGGDRG
jgi:5-methylcytosine-specific restriction protein A